ncbi:MAG: DtxR family transcriptional regulator [Elusimicrobiota bacterium]
MAIICNPGEEALESLWQLNEKGKKLNIKNIETEDSSIQKGVLEKLVEDDHLSKVGNNEYEFTTSGIKKARLLVRRHRLAERLLSDVLEMDKKFLEEQACEFEHIISPETEESICTLLNHPRQCPHGGKIPPGECCRESRKSPQRIVVNLSDLKPGESAKILYYHGIHKNMHQLGDLGVVPGARVRVHQVYPSAIIRVGETDIALDKDILEKIYVRKIQ